MPCTDVMESSNFVVFAVENSINDKIYPQYADFTFYGGLYRDVNLICVPDAHFDLTYHGAPGIKVTPVIDGANANVDIEVWTKNAQGKALTYIITDREGAVVAETTTADTKVSFTLENVRKWNGRIDPYLYTATVKLEDLDTVSMCPPTRNTCLSLTVTTISAGTAAPSKLTVPGSISSTLSIPPSPSVFPSTAAKHCGGTIPTPKPATTPRSIRLFTTSP